MILLVPRPETDRTGIVLTVESTTDGQFCVVLHVHFNATECVAVRGSTRFTSDSDAERHGAALLDHILHVVGATMEHYLPDAPTDPKRMPN